MRQIKSQRGHLLGNADGMASVHLIIENEGLGQEGMPGPSVRAFEFDMSALPSLRQPLRVL